MITQIIYLPTYDWTVIVFYCQKNCDCDVILNTLNSIDCSSEILNNVQELLTEPIYNQGFTFTNTDYNTSIIGICPSDSAQEFQNTLDHEKSHVVTHIANNYLIDSMSEEFQYLAGDLGEKLFDIAQHFLCDTCLYDN